MALFTYKWRIGDRTSQGMGWKYKRENTADSLGMLILACTVGGKLISWLVERGRSWCSVPGYTDQKCHRHFQFFVDSPGNLEGLTKEPKWHCLWRMSACAFLPQLHHIWAPFPSLSQRNEQRYIQSLVYWCLSQNDL